MTIFCCNDKQEDLLLLAEIHAFSLPTGQNINTHDFEKVYERLRKYPRAREKYLQEPRERARRVIAHQHHRAPGFFFFPCESRRKRKAKVLWMKTCEKGKKSQMARYHVNWKVKFCDGLNRLVLGTGLAEPVILFLTETSTCLANKNSAFCYLAGGVHTDSWPISPTSSFTFLSTW